MEPKLYLIPITLGETSIERVLPAYNEKIILHIKFFIVENLRSARRFLKKVNHSINIDNLTFFELNKNTPKEAITSYLTPLEKGHSIGIISEAGCPAIADPGADVVSYAHQKGYTIVPLVGPSSILLSLMASGFNGQSFAFLGYLPIDSGARYQKIKKMEQKIHQENQTQIFIETPYRNMKLLKELIASCNPSTKLCIASNISCEDEIIRTLSIKEWKHTKIDLNKKPTVFLLYK